jgi:TorA maturation chaperone TorD
MEKKMPATVAGRDPAATPDAAIASAAADLLSHWWSRPTEAEVGTWLGAAEIERYVRSGFAVEDPGDASPGPRFSIDQVPGLLDEYERLFVGPGQLPCPPYESYWRDDVPIDLWHSLMGPCTAELRQLYREVGIDISPDAAELPDHVAVQLEALAYALTRADGSAVARELVRAHLSKWLPRLCKQVATQAQSPFYTDLAALTADWLGHIEHLVLGAGGFAPDQTATEPVGPEAARSGPP